MLLKIKLRSPVGGVSGDVAADVLVKDTDEWVNGVFYDGWQSLVLRRL
ncbi:hypothetical protein [Pantoea ananatis]|nr:hypothetical protein [Pantoea ananatis]